MLYKFGTVKEIKKLKGDLPKEVYQAGLNIVTTLDEHYGEDRNVDEGDGGFVLVLQSTDDIAKATDTYIQIDKDTYEYVSFVEHEEMSVECENVVYINALFLRHNEFGINVFMPKDIAPKVLLDDLEDNNEEK